MLDKKGRLFGVVSVIDIFVAMGFAAIIAFGMFQLAGGTGVGIADTPQAVTVGFYIPEVEHFTAEWISVGDSVWDHFTEVDLGYVSDVVVVPALEHNPNADGIIVSSQRTGWYSLDITADLYAFPTQHGFWLQGNTFMIGNTIILRVGDTNVFGHIAHINFK